MEEPEKKTPRLQESCESKEQLTRIGYFENSESPEEIERALVLVVHYEFKGINCIERKGNDEDVKRLKKTFEEKRNCTFRELASPTKEEFLQLISDEKHLYELFNDQPGSSKNAACTNTTPPQLFILYILSHGDENGIIGTDHIASDRFVSFTRDEVLERLSKLEKWDECVKFINFGTSRGNKKDNISDNRCDKEDSIKMTKICSKAYLDKNFILFFSTLETKYANRDEKEGTWFVKNTCKVLDGLSNDTCLTDVLTMIQHKIYEERTFQNEGQSPEFHIYSHRKLFIRPLKRHTDDVSFALSGNKNSTAVPTHFFKWRHENDDDLLTISPRKARILYNENSKQVERLEEALTQNLLFETISCKLSIKTIKETYLATESEDDGNVGCFLTIIFTKIATTHDTDEICILVDGKQIPISEILTHCLLKETKWQYRSRKIIMADRPQLFFFINQPTRIPEYDEGDSLQIALSKFDNLAYSPLKGCLIFIAMEADHVTRQLITYCEGSFLKEGERSLQDLLTEILATGQKQSTNKLGGLLVSTLPYSMNFPDLQRCYVNPGFELNAADIDYDTLIDRITTSCNGVWLVSSNTGMGKSSLTLEIVNDLRRKTSRKIFAEKLANFYTFFCSTYICNLQSFLSRLMRIPLDLVDQFLLDTKPLFLLDGFDGICPDFREQMLRIVSAMAKIKIPFLITTRPEEEREIIKALQGESTIQQIKINALDEKKQIQLLQLKTQKCKEECQRMRGDYIRKGLKDILENPRFLTMICRSEGAKNMYDLLEEIIKQIIIARHDYGVRLSVFQDKIIQILQKIAYEFRTTGQIKKIYEFQLDEINALGIARISRNQLISNNAIEAHNTQEEQHLEVIFSHEGFDHFLVSRAFIDYLKKNGSKPTLNLLGDKDLRQVRAFVESKLSERESESDICKNFKSYAQSCISNGVVLTVVRENLPKIFELIEPLFKFPDATQHQGNFFDGIRMLQTATSTNENIAQKLMEKGALNGASEKDASKIYFLLIEAVKRNNVSIVDGILKNCKNYVQDKLGIACWLASQRGHADVLKLLIENGADIKSKHGKDETTAVHEASRNAHLRCVKALLAKDNKIVDISDKLGRKPIHMACLGGHSDTDLLEFLLKGLKEHNVNVSECQDLEKWTPMHYLARIGNLAVAQFFFEEHRLETDKMIKMSTKNIETPLILAAKYSDASMCKWLMEHGADLRAVDSQQRNAFHWSCTDTAGGGVFEYFRDLYLAKAEEDRKSKEKLLSGDDYVLSTFPEKVARKRKLDESTNKGNSDNKKAFELPDLNGRADEDKTALYLAAANWCGLPIVKDLLQKLKVEAHSTDSRKLNALHVAAKNKNTEVLECLLFQHPDLCPQIEPLANLPFHYKKLFLDRRESKKKKDFYTQ